ncbi:MAG: 4Fe-4S dicluster domain-containing protein [Candidatus Hydrogenedentes bacterium]|nr:4Fe-4S dicluster domain-containing protein [Candidatus Hydrogenedentota bacterium]
MGTMAGLAVTAGVLEPLRSLKDAPSLEEFLQQHYTKLTPDLMDQVLRRVEALMGEEYGAKVRVNDPKPLEGVEFAYALNLTRCNGSRRCVYACMKENNIPLDQPEMAYIRVLEMNIDSLDLEEGNVQYEASAVPREGKYYLPIQCHQCRKPPCTKVCPVEATWTEPDGITVIDYNWCIGCRYCMAACPYEARRFNWTKPSFAADEINPDMGYLSNRVRPRGVVEKCHFCLHRTRLGKNPACAEVCPTGSRIFGNILDPEGKIQFILKNKRVYILKAEAKTIPRFYYFFDN